ncbi:hypothetical protein BXZ70DRAFT_946151 [Cristinia sonorae]|uniref:Yeast cell wall synthesis Kre9/Knh1-like N-terminal domain-containing protein n=1 Tax=Cristinia sonorae TaxID=1940300 RepID=A0A8K0UJP1_9AGAR|nr:hypothetical protein BXZ70DRAFT_946151 [Cristinia sonorae]
MRAFSAATFLSLAASVLAYQVTSPTNATGWTTTGPNVVSWTRVNTDPASFAIVLSNQASFPPQQIVLVALVDGTKDNSLTVNPPSGGWVAGSGYQVNLVKSTEELNTILAQSGDFSITSGTGSSTFSSSTTALTVTPTSRPTTTPTNTLGDQNNSGSTTPTDGDLNPTNTPSGALPTFNMQAGVFAILALLGSFLA